MAWLSDAFQGKCSDHRRRQDWGKLTNCGCASLRPKSAVCLFRQWGLSESQGAHRKYPQKKRSETGRRATGGICLQKADSAQAEGQKGKVWGCSVRGNLSRAEHYRKMAVKYHELGKFAKPAYLGDFYRGVAVRYVLMAQEISERAKREAECSAERCGSRTVECDDGHDRNFGQDRTPRVWAGKDSGE
jgi:hypothetical protein